MRNTTNQWSSRIALVLVCLILMAAASGCPTADDQEGDRPDVLPAASHFLLREANELKAEGPDYILAKYRLFSREDLVILRDTTTVFSGEHLGFDTRRQVDFGDANTGYYISTAVTTDKSTFCAFIFMSYWYLAENELSPEDLDSELEFLADSGQYPIKVLDRDANGVISHLACEVTESPVVAISAVLDHVAKEDGVKSYHISFTVSDQDESSTPISPAS